MMRPTITLEMTVSIRKPLIIYHYPCLDGFTSAYVAWRKFDYDGADYEPGSYSDQAEIPDVDDRLVYILDFSYPAETMREIAKRANKVIVLDHHKSAEANLLPLLEDGTIEGEFDMDRSGAGMTWDYFNPGQPRIPFINYVEDRDIWRKALPDCEEINLAMFSYEYTFENWHRFCHSVEKLRSEGKAIHRKHMKDVRELMEQTMRLTIGGYENIKTVNANYFFGSDLAAILAVDEPFGAYFWLNAKGEFCFGLRSNADNRKAADVSLIAASYGGGGHKHAAGFRVDSLNDL